jgi:thiosulfate/3-mercaptopyruvate sulfurtransferase
VQLFFSVYSVACSTELLAYIVFSRKGSHFESMHMSNLLSVAELKNILSQPDLLIADCRFDVSDPTRGPRAYAEGHISGAVFVPVEYDLSLPAGEHGGRHPLPSIEQLAELFGRLGITRGKTRVICYDDAGGSYAARLWWMLRYLGHETVQLLDGGWQAWHAGDGAVTSDIPLPVPQHFDPEAQAGMLASMEQVRTRDAGESLIDSRAAERFRGEVEPIDKKGGHIPGAVNCPWAAVLDAEARLLPASNLRAHFGEVSSSPIVYCGSGVTACINVLAIHEAGLGMPRLYAGSWSDWITWPDNPIATGPA